MKGRRSKNLGPYEIDVVVSLLDGWSGPLSWNSVIDAIELRLFFRYTRQALSGHERVGDAFRLCKDRLAKAQHKHRSKPQSPEKRAIHERLERRDAEVTRLRAENQQLMEQFVVWLYNAQIRGVSQAELERPLPTVDRGQTRRELRSITGGGNPR